MITHPVDFVEFDRQWRELFVDNPTHEFLLNGKPTKITEEESFPKNWVKYLYCDIPQFVNFGPGDAHGVLDVLHRDEEYYSVAFRKKAEPLPKGWMLVQSGQRRYYARNVSMGMDGWIVLELRVIPHPMNTRHLFKLRASWVEYDPADDVYCERDSLNLPLEDEYRRFAEPKDAILDLEKRVREHFAERL